MAGALGVAPVLLLADIWESPQLDVVRDQPWRRALARVVASASCVALAQLIARGPIALPLLAIGARPFRIPIEVGGDDLEPARAALREDRRRSRRGDRGRAARWELLFKCAAENE